ncbi:MAG: universal stress protein [Nitrospirota bacterium]
MKILVPVDGSKYSMEGVKVAVDYAKTKGAKVFLMTVVPFVAGMDLEVSASKWDKLTTEMKQAGEDALEKAWLYVKSEGAVAQTILSTATNVAEEIINAVGKENINLVVIGSRGLTGAARFMLGSTASKIVNHCPCSVYVVKMPSD